MRFLIKIITILLISSLNVNSGEITDMEWTILGDIKVFYYENVYNQNYSYFPIILNLPINRTKVLKYLEDFGIFAKTYFSPLITEILEMKKCKTITVKNIRNSIDISMKILCLPISSNMTFKEAKYVTSILLKAIKEFEND